MAWDDIDLDALRRDRSFSYYFRYPLNGHDFHPLRVGLRLRGHYESKALHSAFTADGRDCITRPTWPAALGVSSRWTWLVINT